ncbi:hypothetical protein [Priestia megaterium]|uniref:hypothetical protein n=1 Tax=Priestia megaterium TaxID=1404 RepID=UPI0012B7516B|nr:hypothetical protein [Priestia megaterium]
MGKGGNGLEIGEEGVGIGVIGIIYEGGGKVRCDGGGLWLKGGNGVILRGGSEGFDWNEGIVCVLSQGGASGGFGEDRVEVIEDRWRERGVELMKVNEYMDAINGNYG